MQQRLWGETAVYVDNDVDVDDVDDDEEGAAAYFFWSETAMAIPTVNYKSVEDKPFYSMSESSAAVVDTRRRTVHLLHSSSDCLAKERLPLLPCEQMQSSARCSKLISPLPRYRLYFALQRTVPRCEVVFQSITVEIPLDGDMTARPDVPEC